MEATASPPDHRRHPSPLEIIAGALLLASVVLHVSAMFPDYLPFASSSSVSIAFQPDQAALFAVVTAVWAAALGFGLAGPRWVKVAAGAAVGAALGELGFRVSDLGEVFRYGTHVAGSGLWLMTSGWVAGAAGAATAVAALIRSRSWVGSPDPPRSGFNRWGAVAVVGVLSAATAGLFLPAWDHYSGFSAVTGRTISFTLGNAFAEPWQVVTGNVLSAVAIAAVPILAGLWLWRDRQLAAGAVAGVLGMLAAQFAAAVVQVDQPVPPAIAGLSPAQAHQLGLAIGLKLSGWFLADALVAFGLFALVMALATARPVQENSGATLPSAPDARSAATSAWS